MAIAIQASSRSTNWSNNECFLLHLLQISEPTNKDLASWSQVCRGWNNALSSRTLTRLHAKRLTPELYNSIPMEVLEDTSWKTIYKMIVMQDHISQRLGKMNTRTNKLEKQARSQTLRLCSFVLGADNLRVSTNEAYHQINLAEEHLVEIIDHKLQVVAMASLVITTAAAPFAVAEVISGLKVKSFYGSLK